MIVAKGIRDSRLIMVFGSRMVYALSYVEKYMRVRNNEDLCTLDEARYFLRGCLSLPFTDQKGDFSWGIWVEVSEDHHDVYARQM